MKRIFSFLLPAILLALTAGAQERCGFTNLLNGLSPAQRASWEASYAAHVQEVLAREESGQVSKTAGTAPVPVVFHFLLTAAQKAQLGGDTGIIARVNRQLSVLNDDFNALNADQTSIPAGFKPLFGNVGIRFGLAGATSGNTISHGIEVRTLTSAAAYDQTTGFADAKRTAEGGLDAWDPTKYLNVWVFRNDAGILGLAIPIRFVGSGFSGTNRTLTAGDMGVTLHYGVVGRRNDFTEFYLTGNDRGRTMTHEVGHFFNMRHIWGDSQGCSPDDGISDTPPQDDNTYCTSGCPTFPTYDACSPSGNGIMFMNYMDYVDDRAMMMFSKIQASVMAAEVAANGLLVNLTNNPSLAIADAVSLPAGENGLRLFPNPATTQVFVQSATGTKITGFTISDAVGREVYRAAELSGNQNTVSLAGMARGFYLVRATVNGQPFTGRLVLQ